MFGVDLCCLLTRETRSQRASEGSRNCEAVAFICLKQAEAVPESQSRTMDNEKCWRPGVVVRRGMDVELKTIRSLVGGWLGEWKREGAPGVCRSFPEEGHQQTMAVSKPIDRMHLHLGNVQTSRQPCKDDSEEGTSWLT